MCETVEFDYSTSHSHIDEACTEGLDEIGTNSIHKCSKLSM